MRKSSLIQIVSAGVTIVALSACSGGDSGGTSSPAEPSDNASATATSQASQSSAAGGSGETLIVYTNSNANGRAEWLTEQAASAGFDIQVVGQGGGDTTNKLLAEKNNPVADVVFGLNHMYFETLEAADVLTDYTPAWSAEVDQALGDNDADKTYWPVVQQGILLACNSEAAALPTSWTDLWNDEQFHGR